MTSLSIDNQADIIKAFNSTSRYLDDLLNIDNPYFQRMVNQIYPPELKLSKAIASDTEATFLDLHLSIYNGFVSSKIARNKCLMAKLFKQGFRYHKLRKTFSKFYRQHYELISKFNVGLKSLLHQGLSEPEFYGD